MKYKMIYACKKIIKTRYEITYKLKQLISTTQILINFIQIRNKEFKIRTIREAAPNTDINFSVFNVKYHTVTDDTKQT